MRLRCEAKKSDCNSFAIGFFYASGRAKFVLLRFSLQKNIRPLLPFGESAPSRFFFCEFVPCDLFSLTKLQIRLLLPQCCFILQYQFHRTVVAAQNLLMNGGVGEL